MKNNNQKVFFDIPENISLAKIISDIFEKNNIKDSPDDIEYKERLKRLSTINNGAKDLFLKKISEKELTDFLKDKLKITENIALNIVIAIKKEILPFGKKITHQINKIPEKKDLTNEDFRIEEEFNRSIKKNKKIKKSSLPKETEDLIPKPKQQKTGPDNYREPIE